MLNKLFIALIALSLVGVLVTTDVAYAFNEANIQDVSRRGRSCIVGEDCIDGTGFYPISRRGR